MILGTAYWGWTLDKTTCFDILETFMQAGHRRVDAATNYPINNQADCYRASENILLDFIKAHGIHDLQVIMKIGPTSNFRSPDINLSPSFLVMMTDEYHRLFGDNLHTVMVHWDNREDPTSIRATFEAFLAMRERGLQPGLSGIQHPQVYEDLNQTYQLDFHIEMKHHVFYSDMPKYKQLQTGTHQFIAYGINAGGIKLDNRYNDGSSIKVRGGHPEAFQAGVDAINTRIADWNTAYVRPPIVSMNQLGTIFVKHTPEINDYIIGPSSVAQLRNSIELDKDIEIFDYSDVYRYLKGLA